MLLAEAIMILLGQGFKVTRDKDTYFVVYPDGNYSVRVCFEEIIELAVIEEEGA